MAESFNPYHAWLGIPPQEQPPNHYRLLAIARFEANPDVIANAADRQMAFVRTFQGGQHSAEAKRILNELAAARLCLLAPERKAAYDELLRKMAKPEAPRAQATAASAALPVAALDPVLVNPLALVPNPVSQQPGAPKPAAQRPTAMRSTDLPAWQVPAIVGGVVLSALLLIAGIIGWNLSRNEEKAEEVNNVATAADSQHNPAAPTVETNKNQTAPATRAASTGISTFTLADLEQALAHEATGLELRDQALGKGVMQGIGQHRALLQLSFKNCVLSDNDLAQIRGLDKLQKLAIINSAISDTGLRYCQSLKGLQTVELSKLRTTSKGIVDLAAALPELRELLLSDMRIDDRILEHMPRLVNLEHLSVSHHPRITDAGLPHLLGCQRLANLNLEHTGVTDAGLNQLAPLATLRELHLTGAKVSPTGIESLRQELRDCKIVFDDHVPQAIAKTDDTPPASSPPVTILSPFGPPKTTVPPQTVSSSLPRPSESSEPPLELPQKKRPIPAAEEQRQAEREVQEVFGSQMEAARTTAAKVAVAIKLSNAAGDVSQQPSDWYVLMKVSAEIAAEAGDLRKAFATADRMADNFQVDDIAIKAWLQRKAVDVKEPAARKQVADLSLALAEEAIRAEKLEIASQLAKSTTTLAARVRDPAITRQSKNLSERVAALNKLADDAQAARTTLQQQPDDAAAHLALARFLAIGLGRWEEALEHCAKSSDPLLKAAAEREAQASGEAVTQEAAGDAWWDAAEAAQGREQEALQVRAAYWYGSALPRSTGLSHAKMQNRLSIVRVHTPDAGKGADRASTPSSTAGATAGLIGRALVARSDSGLILTYQPGKSLRGSTIVRTLDRPTGFAKGALQITLAGTLILQQDTTVLIWQAGGSSDGGACRLFIDGKGISFVGDEAAKSEVKQVALNRGTHLVSWILVGGDIGDCVMELYDAKTMEPIPLLTTRELANTAAALRYTEKVDVSSDEAIPPRPPELTKP